MLTSSANRIGLIGWGVTENMSFMAIINRVPISGEP